MERGALTPALADWFERRTLPAEDHDPRALADAKRGTTIGVALPALNEAPTIGSICTTIERELIAGCGLVDRLVVVDSRSTDSTAEVARAAGAEVVTAETTGKGAALRRSLQALDTDLIVWIDADIENFGPHFVTRLLAPLLTDTDLMFVKAFYERPVKLTDATLGPGGARVTEIAARPLLNLLHPELAGFVQPLAGECAGRRAALVRVPFFTGYAVDVGLLVDMVDRYGLDAVAQVDLGVRVHRNQDVAALGRMSAELMYALIARAEARGRLKLAEDLADTLVQFQRSGDSLPAIAGSVIEVGSLPPIEDG